MHANNDLMLLEIGNSRAHIRLPLSDKIEHLDIDEAITKYSNKHAVYISVNGRYTKKLTSVKNWKDISSEIHVSGQYDSMGVDRVALCLSRGDGLYVDAGSAITIDRVKGGKYDGGFIALGIEASLKAYRNISKKLVVELDKNIDMDTLAFDTQTSISYGIISPIIDAIANVSQSLPIYFTGGDGEWLSEFLENSIYEEGLIFEGMSNALASTKGLT